MAKIPRPLDDVIYAILRVIPDNYPPREALRLSFEVIIEASMYTAPEAMNAYWTMATGALTSGMALAHAENLEWATTVREIWNNEVDYERYLV